MFDIRPGNRQPFRGHQPSILTISSLRADFGPEPARTPMKPLAASPETSPLTREEEQGRSDPPARGGHHLRPLRTGIAAGRRHLDEPLRRQPAFRAPGAVPNWSARASCCAKKNIGATVRFYSGEEVAQIYEVREMLTRQAALMIPLPAPAELIAQLKELQRQYCARADAHGSARHPRGQRRLSTSRCSPACGIPIWCAHCRIT